MQIRRFSLISIFAIGFSLSIFPGIAHADFAVRALITRKLPSAAPADTDSIRISVFGDGSGARLQLRLLPTDSNPDFGAYYGAPVLKIDFKGWKTVAVPLSRFILQADANTTGSELSAATLVPATIGGIQIALTDENARVFLDDLVWAKGDTADATIVQPIDTFDEAKTEWTPSGDYEQRQAVNFGINKIAAYAKSGNSILFAVNAPALAEKSINTAPLQALLKRKLLPYTVFVRPTLSPILPVSTPTITEANTKPAIRLFACADQTESGTFAIYAAKELKNITVKLSGALLSESKKTALPPESVDIHIVKVWNQSGLDTQNETSSAYTIGELLVKDDREPLAAPLPTIRLTGDPITDIPLGQSKQFWITVRVPKGQPPSIYSGTLAVAAPGIKTTLVPFAVEVLPMRLRSPFLQYGIDFTDRIAADPALFGRELIDIADHGFRFVSLYDTLPALSDALDLYDKAGLSPAGPLILGTAGKDIDNLRQTDKLHEKRTSLDFYYENGDPNTVQSVNRHSQVVAHIADQAAYSQKNDTFDVSVYPVASDIAQKSITAGKRQVAKRDWWTWNIGVENPRRNRLYTGFLLYDTGLNGAGLYGAFPVYKNLPTGSDIYTETAADGAKTGQRPLLAAYPSASGIIPTLQWEAARSGINDIRYITTLKTYIRDLKDAKVRKEVSDEAESWLATVMKRPLIALPPAEIDRYRRGIADRAIKMLTILRGQPGSYSD